MENENDDMFFQQGFGIGPFQMINEIGKGKFSKVFLGIHEKTKEKVAIKQIPKIGEQNLNSVYDEIKIHKKLIHPYLCKMYSVIENPDYLFIVTEYCGGGEIFKKIAEEIDHFEEAQACKIFSQILSGLEYMHNNYIAHCDIKLENMLFDEYGDAKLTDFGLSKSFEGDINFTKVGMSPMYAAPEIFKGKEFKGRNSDIWSMGVCLYLMVCGDFPFQGEDAKELVKNILKNGFEVPDFVSPLFKDLIYNILEKNPINRLTIQQIKEHPWMHIIDFNFMKSPGISINTDIIPIDISFIEEMAGADELQIKKIISDILMNKHNNNTILYYLKIEIKKRNNEISVSDIRPTSQIFLEYINDGKNKLSYYGNDINKRIDEIKKIVLDNLKKKQSEIGDKNKNSSKIKSPKTKDIPLKNNINKDNNPINKPVAKKEKYKKFNSKTFVKFDFLEFIKEEEEEERKRKEEEENNRDNNQNNPFNNYNNNNFNENNPINNNNSQNRNNTNNAFNNQNNNAQNNQIYNLNNQNNNAQNNSFNNQNNQNNNMNPMNINNMNNNNNNKNNNTKINNMNDNNNMIDNNNINMNDNNKINNMNNINNININMNNMNNMNNNNMNINNMKINNNINNNPPDLNSFARFTKATNTGLKNQGNTSYLNAILQFLGSIRTFANYFTQDKSKQYFVDNSQNCPLAFVTHRLFLHLYKYVENQDSEIYTPDSYLKLLALKNLTYKTKKNRNPNDLLFFILYTLHNELNHPKNNNIIVPKNTSDKENVCQSGIMTFQNRYNSIVSNLLNWFQIKEISCQVCNNTTYFFHTFNTFDLDILRVSITNNNNPINIYNCLITNSIARLKKNYCYKCRKYTTMFFLSKIYFSPNTFIFLLNRGSMDQNLMKIRFLIEEKINLKNYIEIQNAPSLYQLNGIVSIDLKNNKYVSFCMSPVDQNWYLYDDEEIKLIDINQVLHFHNNSGNYIPCILKYQSIH